MGSLEPSGSSQGDGSDVGGGDMLSYRLFSLRSKDNKIAANDISQDHFRTALVFC